ncbi:MULTISPECIES: hypothetical protein [unclassified Mycobacterium]|uniref:hypothetical protein n=1 Tax=unclassified Mycobacterium TaxID=2642494 RepID=UPI00096F4430|nr:MULTISPECIES: hypothetical protein [unclassified Mycobacterium]OMC08593.1 hypothetical protein A5736_06130 [Mycobacterium sp. SP-6446]OMC53165.1 hypothetical protein A5747_20805 [Mycobacterium sp. IS-836]
MAAVGGSFPSLSKLLDWPTEHLTQAADSWTSTGNQWDEVFTQIWRDSVAVEWSGHAAEALHGRTAGDKAKVSGLVEQLHTAATVARTGASELYAARSRVRYAVEDAEDAGFEVGDDFAVTDRWSGGSSAERAERQAQAEAFAARIRQSAVQLVGMDQQIASRTTNALNGIANITFPEDDPTTTTTTPPPTPKCDPEDVAKLHREVDDFDRRWTDFERRVNEHNLKPHEFDINDPVQREAAAKYQKETEALKAEEDRLMRERDKLRQDVVTCGIKIINGQVQWPDGSTSPSPTTTPAPTPTPAR